MRLAAQFALLFGIMAIMASAVQAETWDAYGDYAITQAGDNAATKVWQFFSVSDGANTGYELMNSFGNVGYGYNMLKSTTYGDYPCIGKNTAQGTICANPGPSGSAVAIGWKNLSSGTVTVDYNFSISQLQNGNGVTYALFGENAASPLKSDTLAASTSSGPITGTTSVATGKMLYLQLGPNYKGNGNDYYSDYSAITFSVSQVPEPSTIALLSMTLVSLLCYAWRKRK